jgi:hypothetical protein
VESTQTAVRIRRSSRPTRVTRAQLIAMLEEHATREYRAVLAAIGDRQCDSLGNFAMAEHMRRLMAPQTQST